MSRRETTEWDDALLKFGITKATEEALETNECQHNVDQLLEEDDEDEEVIRKYREKRIAELKSASNKHFGEVEEITGQDFVDKVTKAGQDVQVVIHLYKPGIITCSLINNLLPSLASRFRQTKFLKSISTLCIGNFPDENLPGLLIYRNESCIKQIFGPHNFPANMKLEDLEWMLHKAKAIQSEMTEDPRKSGRGTKIFESLDSDTDQDM